MGTQATAPIIGLVLLVGFVVVSALALFATGTLLVESTESDIEDKQLEQSMVGTAATADRVSQGGEPEADWSFEGAGRGSPQVLEGAEAGTITVTHYVGGQPETEVLQEAPMGALRFERDGTEYAYQAGAVWRLEENGRTVLVRAPEIHYQGGTLTFPFINVTGTVTAGSQTGTMTTARTETVYPRTPDQPNPLQNGTVVIEIESPYCDGWQGYFEHRTQGAVIEGCNQTSETVDGEVKIELVVPFELPPIRGAVEAGTISLPGGGGGGGGGPPGGGPPGQNGQAVSHGTDGTSDPSGTTATTQPGPDISGDVYVDDASSVDESRIDGEVQQQNRALPSATDLVGRFIDRCEGFADPGGAIDTAGVHCVDRIDDELDIDTTDGSVEIVVRDHVDLGGNDDITVTGDNGVTVFVDGDLDSRGNQDVGVSGDPLQTRFFVSQNGDVEIQNSNNGQFDALTYAPDSTVRLFGQGTGGPVIADHLDVQNPNPNGPAAEYDESMGAVTIEYGFGGPSIYYLHVTETELEFQGDA